MSAFDRLGAVIYRRRVLTLVLAGAALLASLVVLARGGELTSGSIHGLEAERAQHLADEVTGQPADTTFVALFQADDLDPGDPTFRRALDDALAPLRADPRVRSVTAPGDAGPLLGPRMASAPAHAAFALVGLQGDFKRALAAYPGVRARLRSDRLAITCTGQVPFMRDLDATLERDLLRAEGVSLPLALLVLLAVFGSAVAALLPVGVGGLAVASGIAAVLGLSRVTDIAQYTVNVCSLIGLGVAIDYSLFTVARYREELAAGHGYPEALRRTVATAGRVVAFSGLAVGTGLGGLFFFEGSYLRAMGVGGAIVVLLAVVFALTFLPALLAVLGPRIDAGRIRRAAPPRGGGFWHAAATWVMRRPVRVLVPTLAVLLAMGVPFFHLRLAAADVRVLGAASEARRGHDLLREAFPEEAADRVLVAVSFPTAPALTPDRLDALDTLTRRLAAIPGVTRVESVLDAAPPGLPLPAREALLLHPPPSQAALLAPAIRLFTGERVALVQALTDLPPESDGARRVVRAVREERRVGDGTLLAGGQAAADADAAAYVLARAPRAVGFVVGATVLVLFLLLGSVLLPLKAVAMNAVSIAGSFGALVWIYQDGHLWVREGRPLEPALPVLLFCLLFGLSMDYEVLLLSRIQEAYERTGDSTGAVAQGLEKTAGLITSAAAIMVAVFGAFALARVVLVQSVGVGMALAVALDATLVRVLLVPATMRLFGHANWWAPPALRALRRRLGLGEARR